MRMFSLSLLSCFEAYLFAAATAAASFIAAYYFHYIVSCSNFKQHTLYDTLSFIFFDSILISHIVPQTALPYHFHFIFYKILTFEKLIIK